MQYFQTEIINEVAVVWLNQKDSKVNLIAPSLFGECERLLIALQKNENIKGIVFISKKKDFVAGADLKAIYKTNKAGVWTRHCQKAHQLLNTIENSNKPIVAALHGAAVGGGLEIALACQYRIASNHSSTFFALPEVKVGLLPGGGGTQRLPELIGITEALDMMLTGKSVHAHKAKKIGLVDILVHKNKLLAASVQQAIAMSGKKIIRKKKRNNTDKLVESTNLGLNILLEKARSEVLEQTSGNYPAPFKIIECVEEGIKFGRKVGFTAEIIKFDELSIHPVTKRLINLFFQTTAKKQQAVNNGKEICKTLVVGAGFMGGDIAQFMASKGMDVVVKDVNPARLIATQKAYHRLINKKLNKRIINKLEASQLLSSFKTQQDYQQLNHTQLIIESVYENTTLKQQILATTESATAERCIFATNTSAIPLSTIAKNAKRPEQVIGMHYFSPVQKMPLLEIIVQPQTAPWVIETAINLGIKQSKTCIVVQDKPGFYTTRILTPFINEAMLLLEEGGDIFQIDKAAQQFGFNVGPIALIDEVGIDVATQIMSGELLQLFKANFGNNLKISNVPSLLYQAGYTGRKGKQGFYAYHPKKGTRLAYSIDKNIYSFVGGSERAWLKDKHIRQRLGMMMINEAVRCFEEGVIQSPTDGDLGAVLGLGFPAFTGGPFQYLDTIGCKKAVNRMEKLANKFGQRFLPTQIIYDYERKKQKFYNI